jgi:DNA-binding MarR family transcriptional regulator
MNEPAPVHAGDTLDWLHEQGKRRSDAVPGFDVEETLRKVRAAGQHHSTEQDRDKPGAASNSERDTRDEVARLILALGPSTAAMLGGRLGLTPAAIRRHLDNLITEGLVETRTARTYGNRGRGRPAKVFVISDAGRSVLEQVMGDLPAGALRWMIEQIQQQIAQDAQLQASQFGVVGGENPHKRPWL